MSIRVSVVVPTYRRPQLLRNCLRALFEQQFPADAYEILVVDDASSEETRRLVENFAGERVRKVSPPPALLYVAAPDTQGPAAARNLGWRKARGGIIAFTDDDCLPEPSWLEEGVAAIENGLNAASGQVIVPVPSPPTDYENNISRLAKCEFVTANCFVLRSVLEACGGFDERFRMAWREDSDLQFNLLEHAFVLGHVPAARVVHPVRPAPWGVSIREQKKSMFNALLYKKYPGLYRARVQAGPPLNYYAIVLSAAGFALALLTGHPFLAAGFAFLWGALTLRFAFQRLQHTRHTPSHILEMLYTSMLIPPLSIFWRLAGAVRYQVWFF